jgi:hypothetical protein
MSGVARAMPERILAPDVKLKAYPIGYLHLRTRSSGAHTDPLARTSNLFTIRIQ